MHDIILMECYIYHAIIMCAMWIAVLGGIITIHVVWGKILIFRYRMKKQRDEQNHGNREDRV